MQMIWRLVPVAGDSQRGLRGAYRGKAKRRWGLPRSTRDWTAMNAARKAVRSSAIARRRHLAAGIKWCDAVAPALLPSEPTSGGGLSTRTEHPDERTFELCTMRTLSLCAYIESADNECYVEFDFCATEPTGSSHHEAMAAEGWTISSAEQIVMTNPARGKGLAVVLLTALAETTDRVLG